MRKGTQQKGSGTEYKNRIVQWLFTAKGNTHGNAK